MPTLSNPSEIAREALRQLALRRVAPTPDNYRKLYHEIAGTRPDDDALPEAFVRKLARRLPRDNAERQRHGHQLDQALADGRSKAAEAALKESEAKFRAIADTMPQMVWSTLPDGFHDYYNARWYEFTGVPEGTTDGEGWNDMFHPDDQQRAWEVWSHSLRTGEIYQIEYRLRLQG